MTLRSKWFMASGLLAMVVATVALPLQAEEKTQPSQQQVTETEFGLETLEEVFSLFAEVPQPASKSADEKGVSFTFETAFHRSHKGKHGSYKGKHGSSSLTDDQKLELKKFMMMNGGRLLMLHAEMGVTKEQRGDMKKALLSHRDNLKAKGKAIEKSIRELDAATVADADSKKIIFAADKVGKSVSAAILEVLDGFQDARNVLTKKQQESLDRTLGMVVKSCEEFKTKNGMCPVEMAIRSRRGKGCSGKSCIASAIKSRRYRHSRRSAHFKHKGHGEKHREVKKLIAGNLGRLLVLYSELDITTKQKDQIISNVRGHRGEIKTDLLALRTNGQALVKTVILAKGDKAKKEAANNVGDAVSEIALEITKTRQDVRKVLTGKQKKQIQKTRGEIEQSVKDFRKKMKALKAERKSTKEPKA